MTLGEVMILILGILSGVIVVGLYYMIKTWFKAIYKFDVDVEHLSSDGKSRLELDFAKYDTLEGKDVIKLYKNKCFMPMPDSKNIKYGLKGRRKLEIVLHEDKATGQYMRTNYPDRIKNPFTTEQRGVVMSQVKKAAKRKLGNKLRDMIVPLGFGMYILIGLILILAFWKDVYEPVLKVQKREDDMMNRLEKADERTERMLNLLYEMETGKQIVGSEQNIGGGSNG